LELDLHATFTCCFKRDHCSAVALAAESRRDGEVLAALEVDVPDDVARSALTCDDFTREGGRWDDYHDVEGANAKQI
jgi:hypothetical protein